MLQNRLCFNKHHNHLTYSPSVLFQKERCVNRHSLVQMTRATGTEKKASFLLPTSNLTATPTTSSPVVCYQYHTTQNHGNKDLRSWSR